DVIVIEFTIPPSPPVAAKIVRQVTFALGQPVVASTLIDGLRKKYGPEHDAAQSITWMFDAAGRALTRPLQGSERLCSPGGSPYDGFGWGGGGLMPTADDLTRDSPLQISLSTIRIEDNTQRSAACRAFTFASSFPLGESTPP